MILNVITNRIIYEQNWLLLLILIPLIFFLFWKYLRHSDPSLTVATLKGLHKKKISYLLSPRVLMLILRLITIFFIIMGLADFKVMETTNQKIPISEADIVLALDISKSMLIEDIKPNRLEALKEVLNKFIAGRSNDRLGIVLYAGESLYWCPLTKDYPFLLSKLNKMDEMDLADGTAIGLGLTSAVNALQQSRSKNKIIILLTDGENNTGYIEPLTAAQIAKKYGIKVYCIGIGHTGMASMPITDLNGNKNYVSIQVSIDELTLKKISNYTGGAYFNATDDKTLKNIYATIDKLEKKRMLPIVDVKYSSRYFLFALAALISLFIEIVLKFTIFRTVRL
jgi:Ca-activated chloride channel family protein